MDLICDTASKKMNRFARKLLCHVANFQITPLKRGEKKKKKDPQNIIEKKNEQLLSIQL